MNLAIIPARGGSKRIKNKNIKLFMKKPIIYWSIKAVKESKLFDKIIVSTDSKKIKKICKKYKVDAPFTRPASISKDNVGTAKVVKHALLWFKKKHKLHFDTVCCVYPASPFITGKIIKKGYNLINKRKKDFVFTVSTFPHPIERALKKNKDGSLGPIWRSNTKKRSQHFKDKYHDIGQIYWGTSEAFIKEKQIFSKNSLPIYVPRYLSHDIDTPEDWKKAELVFKSLNLSGIDSL